MTDRRGERRREREYVHDHIDVPRDEYDRSHEYDTDYGGGSGTYVDDRMDLHAPIEHDGRADTRTKWYQEDVPRHKREKYRRLREYQDGMWHTSRSAKNHEADKRRIIDAFASQSDLTKLQRLKTHDLMERLDINSFGQYSTEDITLAAMTVVCDHDMRQLRDEEQYQTLLRSVGLDLSKIRSLRKLIRDRVDDV